MKHYEDLLSIVTEACLITPIYNKRLTRIFGFDNLDKNSGYITDNIIKSHKDVFESVEKSNIVLDYYTNNYTELNSDLFEEKRKNVYRKLQNYYINLSEDIIKYIEDNPNMAYNSNISKHFNFNKFNYGSNDEYVMWTFLVMLENQGILKSRRDGIKKIYSINDKKRFQVIEPIKYQKNVCSQYEAKVAGYLENEKINFISQKKFKDCVYKKELPFDFYLPDHNLLIEVQGQQHYHPVAFFGGQEAFDNLKIRDEIKKKYAEDNDFEFLELKYDRQIVTDLKNFLVNLN